MKNVAVKVFNKQGELVGPLELPFRGRHATLEVGDSLALGELWFRLASELRRSSH